METDVEQRSCHEGDGVGLFAGVLLRAGQAPLLEDCQLFASTKERGPCFHMNSPVASLPPPQLVDSVALRALSLVTVGISTRQSGSPR